MAGYRRTVLTRWLTLLALLVFGTYQGVCFYETWRDTTGKPKLLPNDLTWPAGWRMFTVRDVSNTRLDFEGAAAGTDDEDEATRWVRLPMERWLPSRWDSGYRWERSGRDRGTLDAFLAYACERSGVERARVVEVRWRRQPGEALQTEVDRTVVVRAERRCSKRPPTVAGKVW